MASMLWRGRVSDMPFPLYLTLVGLAFAAWPLLDWMTP